MFKKETLAESAARLDAKCRQRHRQLGSPRLMDEDFDEGSGTAVLKVLNVPALQFFPDGEVRSLHAAYDKTPLGGHRGEIPFVDPALGYIDSLIALASKGFLDLTLFGAELDASKQRRLKRITPRVRGKLAATLWSLKLKSSAIAGFYSILWRHLDRDAARLTFRLYGGRDVTIETYQKVRAHRTLLLELEQEAPQLLPLLTVYCREFNDTLRGQELTLDRAIFGRIKAHMKHTGDAATVQNWAFLPRERLTDAGWRVLSRMGAGGVFIWRSLGYGRVQLLNRLAGAGPVKVPASILRWFRECRIQYLLVGVSEYPEPRARRTLSSDSAERILRLILEQALLAKKKHRLLRFIREELSSVEDALAGSEGLELPRQLSWGWLMRYQEEWHAQQEQIRMAEDEGRSWLSLVESFEHEDYSVVPLASAAALFEEGRIMRHCVYSYADDCLAGESRIFSIRRVGLKRSLATVELRPSRTTSQTHQVWSVKQIEGFARAKPSKELNQLGALIARRYNAKVKELQVQGRASAAIAA
jgi:PcfJ-like protein